MTLRDDNIRYAALKLISDAVEDAKKEERAGHLKVLQESAEDSGSTKWDVTVNGAKVASITLSRRDAALKVTDESALIEWLAAEHPDMIETTVAVKPWATRQILESVVDVTDAGAVNGDGVIIPGVGMSEPGTPYQSLRWNAKADGRYVMAEAIRSGELAEVLAGTGLPMIGGDR